jgi:hypothetical protein
MDIVLRSFLFLGDYSNQSSDLICGIHAYCPLIYKFIIELGEILQSSGEEVVTEKLPVFTLPKDRHLLIFKISFDDARFTIL